MADGIKIITKNRKAFHDYFILETVEAGIALVGTEVKSLREGGINLKDSYARIENGEMVLFGVHISPYDHGNRYNHDPERPRKLLLHRREIWRFKGRSEEKGLTLVPLSFYFKRGRAKVEIGLAKGKQAHDKRDVLQKRDTDREIESALRQKNRDDWG
jgi:SsrA-binding protein